MAPVVVYLTGFRQHAGKTVTSLGIISQLCKHLDPSEIGYLKPVGQQLVPISGGPLVDKDVLLINVLAGLPALPIEHLSPVRFSKNFTRDYLDAANPDEITQGLIRAIHASVAQLADKKIIIAEGSGHPGVGSVVGLSNAAVGKLLGAETIFVSGGGIGRAIDMIDVDLTYFLYHGCRVRGVIINKVAPDKIDLVRHYINADLLNERYGSATGETLEILGYLPELKDLPRPSMRVVLEALHGANSIGEPDTLAWLQPCSSVRTISLPFQVLKLRPYVNPRDLLIISASSSPRIRRLLEYHQEISAEGGIGGLVLTCGETESVEDDMRDEIIAAGVPAVYVEGDSASTEERLFELYRTTKLQLFDMPKMAEIDQLFEEHFETERFLELFLR
jgi:dethiobiotin synthetase